MMILCPESCLFVQYWSLRRAVLHPRRNRYYKCAKRGQLGVRWRYGLLLAPENWHLGSPVRCTTLRQNLTARSLRQLSGLAHYGSS